MYLGSTGFLGLFNYLACPIRSLVARHPRHVSLTHESGRFRVEGDVDLAIAHDATGDVLPFERFRRVDGRGCEPLVTALSTSLIVEAISSGKRWEVAYTHGGRTSLAVTDDERPAYSRWTFVPDTSFFAVESLSLYNFHSYFRRMSYLCPNVRFDLTLDGSTTTYFSRAGIRDMFDAVSAPCQLLHEPVHFQKTLDDLALECVFAFHSGTDDRCWAFLNRTWATEGGTHEEGLVRGFDDVRAALQMPAANDGRRNGVLGIMSLTYPKVVWQGCRRAAIHDPVLGLLVREIIAQGAAEWLRSHPAIESQLHALIPFQFPDDFVSG
jgi:DNA gyrase/topoisomerase IV subunit B